LTAKKNRLENETQKYSHKILTSYPTRSRTSITIIIRFLSIAADCIMMKLIAYKKPQNRWEFLCCSNLRMEIDFFLDYHLKILFNGAVKTFSRENRKMQLNYCICTAECVKMFSDELYYAMHGHHNIQMHIRSEFLSIGFFATQH
jgi:hypothetical protein